MPPATVCVFVSSTWLDLQPEQKAVEATLQRLRETKFVGMEYFGSRDESTHHASLDEVDRSQVYVGIFGERYGSGITEAEYRRARERGLPCFIYFKDEAIILADGRETDPKQADQLAALKEELRHLHTISTFTTPDDLAAKVTADLHRWLFDEYLAPRLEKAAQGEFPLEEAQALLKAIKGLSAPSRNLIAQVMAQGERTIAVGRDAIHSIFITGDHNVVYQTTIQRYLRLKDYIYGEFSDLIVDTTRGFVGRTFLFAELAKFQMQHPCGYVRIVADAGLGKTALAAEIARRYRAPAFFANASIGRTRPDQCLNHLSADLIVRFGLEHDHLPDRAGEDSTFLRRLLAEAAQKVDGPLWVVVDALDEADDPFRGRNPLLLPDDLPHGVYVVLTHRHGDYPLVATPRTPIAEYAISWNDPPQQADIEAYLRRQVERPEIRRVLSEAEPPIPVERFNAVLREASQGNFKYLDYVIEDIATRVPGFDPLNLDMLPKGLQGYYEQVWAHLEQQVWREDVKAWRHLYRPVIALLSAAKEPVTVDWLAHLVGQPAEEVRDQALKRWRRLLSQERRKGQMAWRIVHQSIADFLAEKEREYWRETHTRIADYYLSIWGGLEAALPGLQDPAKRDIDNRYGLRHLAIHLKEAGRVGNLHDLLRVEWRSQEEEPVDIRPGWRGLLDRVLRRPQVRMHIRVVNTWYTVHDQMNNVSGYLRDVTYAWRSLENDSPTSVGLETRYALITASINSLAKNIPRSLLVALVEKDVWDSAQALAYARQMPAPVQRAVALVGLAHQVQEPLKGEVLREALEAARAIQWLEDQVRMLAWVASNLPEPLQQDVLQEILRIQHQPWAFQHLEAWVDAVVDLASQLSERVKKEALSQALAEVRKFTGSDRWEMLTKLAPHLPEHLRMDVLQEALAAVRTIQDDKSTLWGGWAIYRRVKAFADLALHLPDALRVEVLQEALAETSAIQDEGSYSRDEVLVTLAPSLAKPLLPEALRLTHTIKSEDQRSKPLTELAIRMAELGDVQQALATIRALRYKYDQAQGLVRVAPFLPEPLKGEVLQQAHATARAISNAGFRARTLAELSPSLPEPSQSEVWRQAFQAERAFRESKGQSGTIHSSQGLAWEELGVKLPNILQQEALLLVRTLKRAEWRAQGLAGLAPHLPQRLRDEALQEALMAVRAIRNPWEQQRMLKVIAPQLPATLLREALSMTRTIGDESWRPRALVGMVASLPESQRHDAMLEALAAARAIPDRASRVLTLARFMLYLPERLKSNMEQEMLTLTRALENKGQQCQVFAALLPYLTTPLKQAVVQETLNLTRSLHIPERWAGLLRLSPYLGEPSRSEVLREALTGMSMIRDDMDEHEVQEQVRSAWEAIEQMQKRKDTVAGLIPPTPQLLTEEQLPGALAVARMPQEDLAYFLPFSVEGGTELRAEALVGLVPHLEKLPPATLHRLWHETLPPLATRTRKDLLVDIRALAPIIAALGGTEGVLETFRAIQDVGQWWP